MTRIEPQSEDEPVYFILDRAASSLSTRREAHDQEEEYLE
jgi:hypothetical protein